ncbi:hypothetical protein JYT87_03370 [Nitrospira defluvii]|nr:hypothetical protein [Nitrospira defluvii]
MILKVVLEKRGQGDFKATVSDLPGCFSIAMTEDEALEDIEDKILRHLGIEKITQAKTGKDAACSALLRWEISQNNRHNGLP